MLIGNLVPRNLLRGIAFFLCSLALLFAAHAESLQQYAARCEAETQISVPQFDCDDPRSTLVPMTNAFDKNGNRLDFGPQSNFAELFAKVQRGSGGRCDRPDQLNSECDPGSRFRVLNRTADAYVVAHCRKIGNPDNTDTSNGPLGARWGDIAVIQHNTKNGATCFYQEGPRPGLKNTVAAPLADGPNEWNSPAGTRNQGCGGCHDNGPIIRSPYLAQITGPNQLPGAGDSRFNAKGAPYYFVGEDFASWHMFSVEIKGNLCISCHRMGASNVSQLNGTAMDFGIRATAQAPGSAKNPHSAQSPIWMLPGQITYNNDSMKAAVAIRDCAKRRNENPIPNSDGCRITQYDGKPGNTGPWKQFDLRGPNSAASTSRIAVLSRVPDSMETFWVAPNGSVQDSYFYERGGWRHFELSGPSSAATQGGLAAVARHSQTMEVFWVGNDGSIQDAYWYEGQGWKRTTLFPAGSAAQTSNIAAVSRQANTMEIFWVAPDGSLRQGCCFNSGGWRQIQLTAAGNASVNGGIAALSRKSNTVEVFYVGTNGTVRDAYWYAGAPWKFFDLAPPGSTSPSAPITAVARRADTMEVFWVGANGSVQDNYWYESTGWKRFELSAAGSASINGGIKAVARKPNTMEVWWVGANGSIQDAYWYEGAGWKRFELMPPGSASTNGGLTAVPRKPNTMEVWWIGANGTVGDNYWYE